MAVRPDGLVHQITTSEGNGNLVLAAAEGGKQGFMVAYGLAIRFKYYISHRSAQEWEYGEGYLSDATTLVRETPAKGSGAIPVVFTAGTKDVSSDYSSGGIPNSELKQLPANTILGNDTAGTADAKYLTVAQAQALLNAVTKTGDHVMTGTLTAPVFYANTTVYAGASQTNYLTEGTLTVNSPASNAYVQVLKNAVSGFSSIVRGMNANKTRWVVHLGDTTAESGANNTIGSNFNLQAADDAAIKFSVMYAYRETGNVVFWNNVTVGTTLDAPLISAGVNGVTSNGPIQSNGKIGYPQGSSVTQTTSKSATVACNALSGWIQMNGESLAANTSVTFQLNNTKITSSLDHIHAFHQATGSFGSYNIAARCTTAGQALITVRNLTAAALAEGITLRFMLFQGSITGALAELLPAEEISHHDRMRQLLPPDAFMLPADMELEFKPLPPPPAVPALPPPDTLSTSDEADR